ncbi:hypothetical protein CBER1_09250 [Cercospora berteroae]|uniref:Cystathionine gamma-synthase n=1 Tax=Cercospora berteroae TaxID=357750 RepID=A0A2S6BXV6_9PEZI|nr:hypothetical protein CBER1_09250 [Cercospora berteroae]
MVALGRGDPEVINALRNGYPRSILHQDVQTLARKCKERLSPLYQGTIGLSLFPDADSAGACEAYLTSASINGMNASKASLVRKFKFTSDADSKINERCNDRGIDALWAVVYPESASSSAASFWRLTGVGVSSRRAEAYLLQMERMVAVEASKMDPESPRNLETRVHELVRQRIAAVMNSPAPYSKNLERPSSSDVFLFPSGMSAIFNVHRMLLQWRQGESVVLGFPYELTLKMMQTYGPSYKFLSSGSSADIDALEQYLVRRRQAGCTIFKVQAIWCECPSNPLLWTPDLQRVRRLADEHDLVVVVDDTIGTFANVDVLDVADVVISSLTKSFNGFADVLAGSAVFNPSSRHYRDLKTRLNASYVNNLYVYDAIRLELNSRTFLERVACMNETAEYLVDYLRSLLARGARKSSLTQSCGRSWDHILQAIHFPKGSPSMCNYTQQMRPATAEFTPGYGCLFTIEFKTVDMAATFFDALEFNKGPSLGADFTLAQPYVQMVLQREKDWAASHGVRETIIRVSVGLEDKDFLLRRLQCALDAARMPASEFAVSAVL